MSAILLSCEGEYASYHGLDLCYNPLVPAQTSSNGTASGSAVSGLDHVLAHSLSTRDVVQLSGDALIAQKRAEIEAKLAALRKTSSAASSAAPTPRATSVAASATATPSPPILDDMARRIAEAKKRVAEAQSKLAVKDNPYMVSCIVALFPKLSPTNAPHQSVPQASKKKNVVAPEPTQQGAGLKMAAHPILLDDTPTVPQSKKDRYKPMQPKFASIKANVRNAPTPPPAPTPIVPMEVKANPYASASTTPADSGFEGAPKERVGRQFRFNPKGKYVQIANQVRQEAQLEQLKQRIAESAKKAGLDSEFETLEKNIRVCPGRSRASPREY